MSKNYDVEIKVLSAINSMDEGSEAENNESTYKGFLINDGEGRLALSYSEKTDGGLMTTEIHVRDTRVVVKRRGAIVSDMVFSEGRKNTSVYSIPPHSFDMTVECHSLNIQVSDSEGRIDLLYNMEVGGDARSARMRITWSLV